MYYFIGDAGIDYYVQDNVRRLGGCSLNVATHFKRNTPLEATLLYPSSPSNSLIEEHCRKEGIHSLPLIRESQLPCQEIDISPLGEKKFLTYHPGVIQDFIFTEEESEYLSNIKGVIISPLYEQILPFIDQVITHASQCEFIFDFHDTQDFEKKIENILPYLSLSKLSLFGLGPDDQALIAQLKEYTLKNKGEVIITQAAQEIIYYKNSETFKYRPTPIDQVIDSTGAGDSFLGAFLAIDALNQDQLPEQRLQKAALYSSSTLLKKGAL